MKLHAINGSTAPDTPAERSRKRMRAMPKPASLLQCPRCAGREVIETRIGVELVNGKTRGGTKQLVCALCLSRGERVVLA